MSNSRLSLPYFKIVGTNAALKSFLGLCSEWELPVSSANSLFRDDYEHCLMPCYAYDSTQPTNIKLQTLEANSFTAPILFDLQTEFNAAFSMCISIKNELNGIHQ